MSIGEYIRDMRIKKGLTVREVSRLSGVSHPYISQIETGKNSNPSEKTLKNLAKGLDVPYTDLLWEAGKKELYQAEKFKEATIAFSEEDELIEMLDRLMLLENNRDIKYFLETYLNNPEESIQPLYNGHGLYREDSRRILNVLKEIFPEYQTEKEKE